MESKIVGGILAQALVELPRITSAELYVRCTGQIGNATLAQFQVQMKQWFANNEFPQYEARKGPTGGYYKKGAPTVSKNSNVENSEKIKLDPNVIIEKLNSILDSAPRVVAGELFEVLKAENQIDNMTESQFRIQLSQWFSDGTLAGFESRKGPTGGIYKRGTESEKWVPETETEEFSDSFSVQVTSNLKIVHTDERNWTVQKLSGEVWHNKAYHSDLGSCIKCVVKHAINGEFKLTNSVVQLKDLYSLFMDMENRISAQLEKQISVNE